ncbi:hypothetical protein DR79_409 [Francisella tularensis]|uniref:Uncharacterized protein n=2 Tax=Francisella tularensis TaxID=263 RepID=A0AAW3D6D2_FRATU|nr:hypothetical protein NE061598_05770 [Francisella tularensis subsp. tularensis NE061598]AFB79094.1 hypothetical protein FTU_1046 [Francisella tularensis subsp. tularensis TIGB03]AFB80639.1 hypothetical protein FTV_0962 [Francisella tularensis subsp. tularensis TI0902]AJI69731.1 hypothetical protein BZ14_1844 [Francisella tularensis subsp. tularensis SCHU S4]AJI71088.1 hypothetical protein CH69_881 [Francisella tularensis subsp. tularensis]AKE19964.1 hypothetical protein RO31_1161 [Francisell
MSNFLMLIDEMSNYIIFYDSTIISKFRLKLFKLVNLVVRLLKIILNKFFVILMFNSSYNQI